MPRITDVVKNLLIINVLMFVAFYFVFAHLREYLPLYYPASDYFKPYQLITHMFMHGDPTHLLFNMLSLFFIGPMVETQLGGKKFLQFYLICGFGSMILHLLLTYVGFLPPVPIVGASGAIMGIFIAFAMMFPDVKLMLLFPPIPIKAKYLMIGLICFDLFSGVSGVKTGIAHFAHLGGAVAGFILIYLWKKNKFNRWG